MDAEADAGWAALIAVAELPEGKPKPATLDDQELLLVRVGEDVFALGNRCTHQGAALNRGPVRTGSPRTVTCPLHGSVFRLEDGRVMRGPATAPLPAFDARVVDGMVEVRPRS